MIDFPEPDNFDDIYAVRNEHLTWDVIGYSMDERGNRKSRAITENVANKPLAEAFIRWYTDKYWSTMFDGPSD
ncbi:hypothetical protein SEA_SHAM_147 [Streptomyces phage Sham]|nr:hypothetical protein SEA_SHAM_147 [Streptomyces phage Sham]